MKQEICLTGIFEQAHHCVNHLTVQVSEMSLFKEEVMTVNESRDNAEAQKWKKQRLECEVELSEASSYSNCQDGAKVVRNQQDGQKEERGHNAGQRWPQQPLHLIHDKPNQASHSLGRN